MRVMGKSADLARESRRPDGHRRRGRQRGQSLVEFSVVLPVLLAIVGIVIDASRVYQAWTDLESATRDAAQYLARSSVDPLSPDYTSEGLDSDTKAIYLLNEATNMSFSRSEEQGELTDCDQAQLTTTFSTSTALTAGGSTAYPLGTAKVMTCMSFRTLFPYPFIGNDGAWIIRSEREMTLIVGR
jgi:Flp pilus assembly protein TadG